MANSSIYNAFSRMWQYVTNALNNKADKTEATQSSAGLLSAANKTQLDYGGIPIIKTGGTSAAYTATVSGVTALTPGIVLTLIPHATSTSTSPTLNLNGLGAKTIYAPTSGSSTSTTVGPAAGWLVINTPIIVVYNGTYWITINITRPHPSYLSSTVPINKGGTGATTAAAALTALGGMPNVVVTASDAGKFLRVNSSGVWAAESIPNAEEASF